MKKLVSLLVMMFLLLLTGCSSSIKDVDMIQLQKVSQDVSENKSYTIYKKDGDFYMNVSLTENNELVYIEGQKLPQEMIDKATQLINKKGFSYSKNEILKRQSNEVYYMLTISSSGKTYQTAIDDKDIVELFDDIYENYFLPADEKWKSLDFSAIEVKD